MLGPARMDEDAYLALDRRSEHKHELWDGEVYAMSGASFDRGDKFAAYRSIAGLDEVVFISQHERRVETYTRQADDSWLMRESRGDGGLVLSSLSAPISLDRIYRDVQDLAR